MSSTRTPKYISRYVLRLRFIKQTQASKQAEVPQLPKLIGFLKVLFIFRERRREGEKHQCVRDTLISCLSHAPYWGAGP